jgi:pSer/pThr/pTyr-binding forkhead associated (FHA) protein
MALSPATGPTRTAQSPQGPALIPLGHHEGKPPIPLNRPVTVIGSRNNARIHLLSSTVSKAHALLVLTDTGAYIADLASRTKTLVNGQPVRDVDLKDGDTLAIGKFLFRYVAGRTRGRSRFGAADPAVLDVAGAPIPVPLEHRVTLIGRRGGADIPLVEESVSTAHAVIFERDGKRYVRDLGSRTGTHLNGKSVHQEELRFGDQLRIGDTDIVYDEASAAGQEEHAAASVSGLILEDEPAVPSPVRPASPIAPVAPLAEAPAPAARRPAPEPPSAPPLVATPPAQPRGIDLVPLDVDDLPTEPAPAAEAAPAAPPADADRHADTAIAVAPIDETEDDDALDLAPAPGTATVQAGPATPMIEVVPDVSGPADAADAEDARDADDADLDPAPAAAAADARPPADQVRPPAAARDEIEPLVPVLDDAPADVDAPPPTARRGWRGSQPLSEFRPEKVARKASPDDTTVDVPSPAREPIFETLPPGGAPRLERPAPAPENDEAPAAPAAVGPAVDTPPLDPSGEHAAAGAADAVAEVPPAADEPLPLDLVDEPVDEPATPTAAAAEVVDEAAPVSLSAEASSLRPVNAPLAEPLDEVEADLADVADAAPAEETAPAVGALDAADAAVEPAGPGRHDDVAPEPEPVAERRAEPAEPLVELSGPVDEAAHAAELQVAPAETEIAAAAEPVAEPAEPVAAIETEEPVVADLRPTGDEVPPPVIEAADEDDVAAWLSAETAPAAEAVSAKDATPEPPEPVVEIDHAALATGAAGVEAADVDDAAEPAVLPVEPTAAQPVAPQADVSVAAAEVIESTEPTPESAQPAFPAAPGLSLDADDDVVTADALSDTGLAREVAVISDASLGPVELTPAAAVETPEAEAIESPAAPEPSESDISFVIAPPAEAVEAVDVLDAATADDEDAARLPGDAHADAYAAAAQTRIAPEPDDEPLLAAEAVDAPAELDADALAEARTTEPAGAAPADVPGDAAEDTLVAAREPATAPAADAPSPTRPAAPPTAVPQSVDVFGFGTDQDAFFGGMGLALNAGAPAAPASPAKPAPPAAARANDDLIAGALGLGMPAAAAAPPAAPQPPVDDSLQAHPHEDVPPAETPATPTSWLSPAAPAGPAATETPAAEDESAAPRRRRRRRGRDAAGEEAAAPAATTSSDAPAAPAPPAGAPGLEDGFVAPLRAGPAGRRRPLSVDVFSQVPADGTGLGGFASPPATDGLTGQPAAEPGADAPAENLLRPAARARAAGRAVLPSLAAQGTVPTPAGPGPAAAAASAARQQQYLPDFDEEAAAARLHEAYRRKHRRVVALVTVGVALALAAFAAAWKFVPVNHTVEARLRYRNLGGVSRDAQLDLVAAQKELLASRGLRDQARALLDSYKPPQPVEPGFLGDPVEFGRVAAGADFRLGDDGMLVISHRGPDRDGDFFRLKAVAEAMYAANRTTLVDAASRTRQAVADLDRKIKDNQARLKQVAADIERLRTVGDSAVNTAERLDQVKRDLKLATAQQDAALEAEAKLRADLRVLQAATPPPDDAEVARLLEADAVLKSLNDRLQSATAQLNELRARPQAQAGDARKQLDEAIDQFQREIAAAQSSMPANEELAKYLASAQGLMENTRTLSTNLIKRQEQQLQKLNALRQRHEEAVAQRRLDKWAGDAQYKELQQNLEFARRQLSVAESGKLDAEAAEIRLRIRTLEDRIAARQNELGDDPRDVAFATTLKEMVEAQEQTMRADREDVARRLAEFEQQFVSSQPAASRLPEEQQALAAKMKERLAAIAAARQAYNQSVDTAGESDKQKTEGLTAEVAQLRTQVDARRKELVNTVSSDLARQHEQERQLQIADREKQLAAAQNELKEVGTKVAALRREEADLNRQLAAANAAGDSLQAAQADKQSLEAEGEAYRNDLTGKQNSLRTLVEPVPVDDGAITKRDGEDQRLLYAGSAAGAIMVVFLALAFVVGAQQIPLPPGVTSEYELGELSPELLANLPPANLPSASLTGQNGHANGSTTSANGDGKPADPDREPAVV